MLFSSLSLGTFTTEGLRFQRLGLLTSEDLDRMV